MPLLLDYSYVLGFLIIGIGFVVVNTLVPLFISPRSRGERRSDPYESGEVPVGSAWVQFDINYYLFALVFLAFDVEVGFLFPVIVIYKEVMSFAVFIELLMFLGILSLAILYAWRKGLFAWR